MAYLLMQALRRLGLVGTELAKAQCNTVRLKLPKTFIFILYAATSNNIYVRSPLEYHTLIKPRLLDGKQRAFCFPTRSAVSHKPSRQASVEWHEELSIAHFLRIPCAVLDIAQSSGAIEASPLYPSVSLLIQLPRDL